MRFVRVFTEFASSNYAVPEEWSKQQGEIKGGTPHLIALRYDRQAERRVVAKIAYGLFRVVTGRCLEPERDRSIRRYILGLTDSSVEPVFTEPIPVNPTTSDEPHCILLSPPNDRQSVFLSFYSCHRYRVELGPEGELPTPVAILCDIHGNGIRVTVPCDPIFARFAECRFSLPSEWPPEGRGAVNPAGTGKGRRF